MDLENTKSFIKEELLCHGADIVGFGNLTDLPEGPRYGMPTGISIAVKYPKEVIRGIYDLPTPEYFEQYNLLNKKLDMLAEICGDLLEMHGFEAIPMTGSFVEQNKENLTTQLPHKTVATHAGVGWIGKCALLVTKKYGSMIRLTSVLTDAPFKTVKAITTSKCGTCMKCTEACPGSAVSGKNWSAKTYRDDFFDAKQCQKTCWERALKGIGKQVNQCGRCVLVCPFTQAFLNKE